MKKNYETPDLVGAKALDNYLIYLMYETKEEKIYDMKKLINENKFYNKLKDKEYFKTLKVRGDSIEWEQGEDVAPESLYYDSVDTSKYK